MGIIQVTLDFTPQVGQTLTLLNNTGSQPIAGIFDGLSEGAGFVVEHGGNNYTFVISYQGGDGNDITLRRAPMVLPTLVKDIHTGPVPEADAGYISASCQVGQAFYFAARDVVHGYSLWKQEEGKVTLVKADCTPSALAEMGGVLYFSGSEGYYGQQLWKTDGTPGGTSMVTNLSEGGSPEGLVRAGDWIYYISRANLWRTDGSTAGTSMVKDFKAAGALCYSLAAAGTNLFIVAGTQATGQELWKSDGTSAGTVMVKDVSPGSGSGLFLSSPEFVALGDLMFFRAITPDNGTELWRSDGTAAGTFLLKDIQTGSASGNPRYITVLGGAVYFSANNGTNGNELWKSDGTEAGTTLLKDIQPGSGSSNPLAIKETGGRLLFAANNGPNGSEPWISDGSASGTVMLKDLNPGAGSSLATFFSGAGGTFYFRATDGTRGFEVWKTDGTGAGTTLLKDITAGAGSTTLQGLWASPGRVRFAAMNATGGYSLWESNGSEAGTRRVAAFMAGTADSYPGSLVKVGNTVFFTAFTPATGHELWKTDGTTAGTSLVKDIVPGTADSSISELTASGTTLFFTAYTAAAGRELWKSDGTAAGTVMVKDIWQGDGDGDPAGLVAMNGYVYFAANASSTGRELWRSDGTSAGTTLVADLVSGTGMGVGPENLTTAGGNLFFTSASTNRLYRSNGTQAGTWIFPDVTSVSGLRSVGNTLYFAGSNGTHGVELWKSDGTLSGTSMVRDIEPGAPSSSPNLVAAAGDNLYFVRTTINSNPNHHELWRSNGTQAGTSLVKTISSAYIDCSAMGNILFFGDNDASAGYEPWRTDGTVAGTFRVKDIWPGMASADPQKFLADGSRTYFSANDGVNGTELWVTDGTPAGTFMAANLAAGRGGSFPVPGIMLGSKLLLSCKSDEYGQELHVFDPTLPDPPSVTVAESSVTPTGAVLTATINPNGPSTVAVLKWGTTTLPENSSEIPLPAANGNSPNVVNLPLQDLAAGTTYFYQVQATSVSGTTRTEIASLVTPAPGPEIAISLHDGPPLPNGPGVVSYGSVVTGTSSVIQLDITNSGVGLLTNFSFAFEGPASSSFDLVEYPSSVVGTGDVTSLRIAFSPTATGNQAAVIRISSNDPDDSPYVITLSGEGVTATGVFEDFASSAGLSGPQASPRATPFGDGVENLVKYAFNMNLGGADTRTMVQGGNAGLPLVAVSGASTAAPVLSVEFLRRKGSGISYVPQRSSSLNSFVSMAGSTTVTSLGGDWELVKVEETLAPGAATGCFARVKISLP